jgi:hypothetical protein
MPNPNPAWTPFIFELAAEARDSSTPTARIVRVLPSMLSTGAAPLEIARVAHASPESVDSLLKELASYRLVDTQPSGSTLPFARELYHLSHDGPLFFRELNTLLSSSSSSSSFGR